MVSVALVTLLVGRIILARGAAVDPSGKPEAPSDKASSGSHDVGVSVVETTDPKAISNFLSSFASPVAPITGGGDMATPWSAGYPLFSAFNGFCTPWYCPPRFFLSQGVQDSTGLAPIVRPFDVPASNLDNLSPVGPSVFRSPGIRRDLSDEEHDTVKPQEKTSVPQNKENQKDLHANTNTTCNNSKESPKLALAGDLKKDDIKTTSEKKTIV